MITDQLRHFQVFDICIWFPFNVFVYLLSFHGFVLTDWRITFQWNSQYLALRGERNPSFPLWGPEVNFLSELVIMICTLYFLTFYSCPVSRRRGGERGVYKDTCIEFQVRLYYRNFLTQGIYLECLHLCLACFLILGHCKCCHSSVFTMEHTLVLLCYGRSLSQNWCRML